MALDAYRDGDRFIVNMDLPGVDPESIELTVAKNVLTVRAERTWERAECVEVLVAERPQGVFSRQLFLGDALDSHRINATYQNGVLTLEIPVAEQAKPLRIQISHSSGESQSIPANSRETEMASPSNPS